MSLNEENIFYPGSIFRITRTYYESPSSEYSEDYHLLLIQEDNKKCIFITLSNGNRWSTEKIKSSVKSNVSIMPAFTLEDIRSYFNKYSINNIEYLGHSSSIDYEALPTL